MAEGIPLRLALVAVIGVPKRLTRAVANGATGHRTPIVCIPAVTFGGSDGAARGRIVNGPGQNFSTTRENARDGSITASASAIESTRSRIGLDSARPFIWKIRSTAAALNGSAPIP